MLAALAAKLETGQFKDFWASITPLRSLLDSVQGFDDLIRECTLPTSWGCSGGRR